jgi:ribosomal-protein-alanine N-acetyltransferase
MLSLAASGPTLALRFPEPADAAALFELARDPVVTRFFSWGPYERVEQAEAYVARLAAEREAGTQLDFLVTRGGTPIGVTGLGEISGRDRRAVVGTWLGRAWWGTGANAEAKALIARIGFDALGLERLGAYASPHNPRSQRALEKLGFVHEGTLRAFHRHGDQVHDVRVYSLLRDDFVRGPLADVPVTVEGASPAAAAPS